MRSPRRQMPNFSHVTRLVLQVFLFCYSVVPGPSAHAGQNSVVLTPAQQIELMETVRTLQRELAELRSEVRTLKAQKAATAKAGGLKTEDYGNRVPGAAEGEAPAGGWLKESFGGVMKQVNEAKDKLQKRNDEINKLEKELP